LKCTEKFNSNCPIEKIVTEHEETKMNIKTNGLFLISFLMNFIEH